MKASEAIAVLKESQGRHTYQVYCPGLKKNLTLSQITVGRQKTVSKLSLVGGNDFYKGLIALILDLSGEDLNLAEMTELDRDICLCAIKENNMQDPVRYKITCSSCGHQFAHAVDFENFQKQLQEIEFENIVKKYEIDDIVIEIELGMPSLMDIVLFREYVENKLNKELDKEELDEESDNDPDVYQTTSIESLVAFIKSIKINGLKIDDLEESIPNRIELIDMLPKDVVYGNDNIGLEINDRYVKTYHSLIYYVECPECKKQATTLLRADNFFF